MMERINFLKINFIFFVLLSLLLVFPINIANASYDFGTHTKGEQDALCGANAGSDVRNSLVLSIVTLCLPGILQKIYDWNQIKCQEVQCMYDAVENHLDPSFCTRTKSYEVCTMIIGEVFAIPPMAILDYYRKIVSRIISNPAGILWSVAYNAANLNLKATYPKHSPIVGAEAVFVGITNIARAVQDLVDIMKYGFFPPGIKNGEDYCKDMDKIKKEMEEIVKNS